MNIYDKPFKPLLAGKAEMLKLQFPVAASPKIDGIRCIILNEVPVSRTLKPIRNKVIREELTGITYILDGELVAADGNFQSSTTAVMAEDSTIPWIYYVFDIIDPNGNPDEPFSNRLIRLREIFDSGELPAHCQLLPQEYLYDREAVEEVHKDHLLQGHEGTILRRADGRYKFGRSTVNEGILLKLKQFADAEAKVIGFEELMHNDNEATTNALGHTERSSHKDNKRASGKLGAFIVESISDPDIQFKVGSGFTDEQRIDFWSRQGELIGSLVKYKYFDFGIKDKPRHPIFLGFRDADDLS